MKTRNLSWLGLVAFLAVPVYAADSPAPPVSEAIPGPVAQAPSAPAPSLPALPPNAAEVVKLSHANLGDDVILGYVKNCQSPFNLSANTILRLKDAGVSSPVIAAMLTHDTSLRDQNPPVQSAPAEPPPTQAAPQPQLVSPGVPPADQVPPPAPVEVVTVAPGPDYYWTPGYWGWNGGWIWIGGGWGFRGGYRWGGYHGGGWYGHGGWGGFHGGGGGFHSGGGGGGHGGGGRGR